VAVTHTFKRVLTERGIDPSKISVVTNGVDLSHFISMPKDQDLLKSFNLQGKFVAGYIGTHGMAHSLETLLDAAYILKAKYLTDNISFLFLGDGACKKDLIEKANRLKLDNVIFLDSVSKEQVKKYWSILDVSIIHLRKEQLFQTVIPSKLFESMGMGIPVLHGVPGESAEIVKANNVGEIFDSENPEQMASVLWKLYKNPELLKIFRGNALKAAHNFERKRLANEMLDIVAVLGGK
jgi:glycosyltransferase involved in cell wall biosynthesis